MVNKCIAKRHKDGTVLVSIGLEGNGFVFNQSAGNPPSPIPDTWILLDSCSTANIFSNPALLWNIHKTDKELTVYCNTGTKTTNLKGTLPGYGLIWYNQDSIANIFSLALVKNRFLIRYDSLNGNGFVVFKLDGSICVFKEANIGPKHLYYFDTASDKSNKDAFTLINTVADNKSKFSNQDYSCVVLA